jgi:protein O-mannosyl-transferase
MTKSALSLEASADNAPSVTLAWGLNQREAAILATILVATAVVYMPSLRFGWVWDDKAQTIQAKDLQSLAGIGKSFIYDSWWFRDPKNLPQSAYYRPFQTVWFGLNYLIIGNHPAVWHLEKIVIELVGVIVCFRLAQLLTRNNAIALLTAAIFGLLPANIESVVWCSAIGEPLSAIFEMGAMCCLINREPGESRGLAFALMLYAGALLSHETAVLFWLVIAAYLFLIEGKPVGESLRIAAPFMLLAVAYLCARLGALGITNFAGRPDFVIPTVALGWEKPFPPRGLIDIIMTMPVALLFYLGILAVPGMAGPTHNVRWITALSPISVAAAGILLVLGVVAWRLIRRGPDWRVYLFCAVWGLVAIAPAMNLKALAVLVQDRILYAPSFAWSFAVSIAAIRIAASSSRARTIVAGAISLLLIANAATIVRVERYWRDDVTFFSRCLAIAPHHAEYLRGLVDMLNWSGDYGSAANVLQNSVNLDPDNIYLHTKLADQYAMMGRGAEFEAETVKIRALRNRPRNAREPATTPR